MTQPHRKEKCIMKLVVAVFNFLFFFLICSFHIANFHLNLHTMEQMIPWCLTIITMLNGWSSTSLILRFWKTLILMYIKHLKGLVAMVFQDWGSNSKSRWHVDLKLQRLLLSWESHLYYREKKQQNFITIDKLQHFEKDL